MIKTITVAATILLLASSAASAQERAGDAALGAVSGALVLGPIGAVAGAFIGYSAGPSISRSWGVGSGSARHRRQASRDGVRRAQDSGGAESKPGDARVATSQSEATAPAPKPLAPSDTTPPVQTLE
jgi:hypothetical protein